MLRGRRRAGEENGVSVFGCFENGGRGKRDFMGTYASAGTGFGFFDCWFGEAGPCGADFAEVSWECLEGGEAGCWGAGAQALGGCG